VFAVKENRKSFPPERRIKLGIGWLVLFLLDLFGIRRGAIIFMESSLSSLFLLFLARHFFSPFFAFIGSRMSWQSTLLSLRRIYSMKKEIIPIIFILSFFPGAHSLKMRSQSPPVPGLVREFYPIDLTHVSTSSQPKEFLFR